MTATELLEFDPIEHRYTLDGRPLVSVTQVIEKLKLSPPYPPDNGAMAFGTAVHKACELAAWGRLDLSSTSPVLIPYVNGFLEKYREMRIRPIKTELRLYHGLEQYAGTTDLWCEIFDGEQAVIDFKSGVPPMCVELQLAGYVEAMAWMTNNGLLPTLAKGGMRLPKLPRRFSMQLLPDRAIVREHKDEYDYAAWIGAVRLYKWKFERRK